MDNPPVEGIPKLTKSRQFEFFDEFTEFLNNNIGAVSKRPLAYIVRKEANIINDDTQSPYGELDSQFGTHFNEIEACAPIIQMDKHGVRGLDKHVQTDNKAVWKLLHAAVKDTEYVTHIKKFQKKQDGRKAFLALHISLLGRQVIDNHTGAAETKLQSLT